MKASKFNVTRDFARAQMPDGPPWPLQDPPEQK
jgi:hypothetical protein